jgi:hypothetical protein
MNHTPVQYRKKPVVIFAMGPLSPANVQDISQWCGSTVWDANAPYLAITTLEGVMMATEGDFIIQGVAGEFYPCRPDIFEKTYELVEKTAEAL